MFKYWDDVQKRSDTKIKGYINIQRAKSDEDMKRHTSALSEEYQSKLSAIAENVGTLMEDSTIIKENLEFLKNGLKKKVDYDEFMALEKRMTIVEAKVRK